MTLNIRFRENDGALVTSPRVGFPPVFDACPPLGFGRHVKEISDRNSGERGFYETATTDVCRTLSSKPMARVPCSASATRRPRSLEAALPQPSCERPTSWRTGAARFSASLREFCPRSSSPTKRFRWSQRGISGSPQRVCSPRAVVASGSSSWQGRASTLRATSQRPWPAPSESRSRCRRHRRTRWSQR